MSDRNSDVVEVVRARRFELVGETGNVLAVLEPDPFTPDGGDPGAHLVLRAANGDARVYLHAWESGAIELSRKGDEGCVTAGMDATGGPWVSPSASRAT